jgi:hypothetical protein
MCETPLDVRPPEGERFGDAAERLAQCVRRQMKKNGKPVLGLVVRPMALAMIQCTLQSRPVTEFWSDWRAGTPTVPIVVDSVDKTT